MKNKKQKKTENAEAQIEKLKGEGKDKQKENHRRGRSHGDCLRRGVHRASAGDVRSKIPAAALRNSFNTQSPRGRAASAIFSTILLKSWFT